MHKLSNGMGKLQQTRILLAPLFFLARLTAPLGYLWLNPRHKFGITPGMAMGVWNDTQAATKRLGTCTVARWDRGELHGESIFSPAHK